MPIWFIMRKIFLLTSFFIATPTLILVTIIFLSFLTFNQKNKGILPLNFSHKVAFAALPSLKNRFEDKFIQKDARVEIVKQFFNEYQSPLEPFATKIVEAADIYNIDFRLLPAIAMQESSLCKKMPANSYNCWGFGIYGGRIKMFDNYSRAIDTVSKTLSYEYKNKGLKTPKEIASKYTPSDNGKWVKAVSRFMEYLQ